MKSHSRETKVLVILAVSIFLGAILLNALGHNPPSAGAFCLSRYHKLGSVEQAITSYTDQLPNRWNLIEVFYSGDNSNNIKQLSPVKNASELADITSHFIICNGRIGYDGQIQPTEKWQRQLSITPEPNLKGKNSGQNVSSDRTTFWMPTNSGDRFIDHDKQTIRICVIADVKSNSPTDCQIKRTEELVEHLCRKFYILPAYVHYPSGWQ